jgi:16S rRNA (cytosine967-C5)-methyltransferase
VDRGLLQSLASGSARQAWHYQVVLRPLLAKPPNEPLIDALLLVGAYQLLALRIPDHAAISETVEAARQLGKEKLTGFINGVLRRLLREREHLLAQAEGAAHAHPQWLLKALKSDWPESWPQIIAANNEISPITLRVNRRHGSRETYLARLAAAGIAAVACRHAPDGVRLADTQDVRALPGFAEGDFSVQDEAAQLAALLLAPAPGHRVLDACAAPGGKTTHLLEAQPEIGSLLALDVDAQRCRRIDENIARLQLQGPEVRVVAGDAATPARWSDGRLFDRILLDAPCTATGVIRRHPDIKLLRKPEDVGPTAQQQAALLDVLWHQLAVGGRLLYATCSVLKDENERNIANFLRRTPSAREIVIDASWGEARPQGRQWLPKVGENDGFYYALLEKTAG